MKRFEAAGATSSGEDAVTTKPAKKTKPTTSNKTAKDEDGEDDGEDVEPPQKKAK